MLFDALVLTNEDVLVRRSSASTTSIYAAFTHACLATRCRTKTFYKSIL